MFILTVLRCALECVARRCDGAVALGALPEKCGILVEECQTPSAVLNVWCVYFHVNLLLTGRTVEMKCFLRESWEPETRLHVVPSNLWRMNNDADHISNIHISLASRQVCARDSAFQDVDTSFEEGTCHESTRVFTSRAGFVADRTFLGA